MNPDTLSAKETSTLFIECHASEDIINTNFNILLDNAFNNDLDMSSLGFKVDMDNLKNAKIVIHGKQILTKLPLQITVSRDTFIADINVETKLELVFVTEVEISPEWKLKTITTLEDYSWLEVPEVSLGKLNFNIKGLSEIVIDKNRDTLETLIDTTIANQFNIKSELDNLLTSLRKPLSIEPSNTLHVQIDIDKLILSSVKYFKKQFTFSCGALGHLNITDKQQNDAIVKPQFEWNDANKNTKLICDIECHLEGLQRMLDYFLKGKVFDVKNRKLKILNPVIMIEQDTVKIYLNVEGDVNGSVNVIGQPILDRENRRLFIQLMDLEFNTKNIIHKSIVWVLKSKIRETLDKLLVLDFDEEFLKIQKLIDDACADINAKGVFTVRNILQKIDIIKFGIVHNTIKGQMLLEGHLNIELIDTIDNSQNNIS